MAFKIRTKADTIYTLNFRGSIIQYRPLTNAENIQIRAECTSKTSKRRADGKLVFEETTDWDKLFITKFQRMILSWDFVCEDDSPRVCNDETKADFINLNTAAAIDIIKEIEEIETEGTKVEEKNY